MTNKIIIHLCDHTEALRRAGSLRGVARELATDWVNTVPIGFFDTRREGCMLVGEGHVRVYVSGYSIPCFVVDVILEG